MKKDYFCRIRILFRSIYKRCVFYITRRKCWPCPHLKCKGRGGGLCMHPSWDKHILTMGHYPYRYKHSRCQIEGLQRLPYDLEPPFDLFLNNSGAAASQRRSR